MEQKIEASTKKPASSGFRILPLTIAGILLFVVGISGGVVGWYFLGTNSPRNAKKPITDEKPTIAVVLPNVEPSRAQFEGNTAQSESPQPAASVEISTPPSAERVSAPAGELPVEGGEIAIGGGDTGRPLQREVVKPFAIAETEVTIGQFREFVEAVKDSNEAIKAMKLPAGKDDEPMTMVDWYQAKAYCDWLGQKISAEVRLPTEAEWEMAARGKSGLKYPWGNEWRDGAAASSETKGTLRPVKTTAINKSPFGAYDMAGNVWEWTATEAQFQNTGDPKNTPRYNEATYAIKGGSYEDVKANITGQARTLVPRGTRLRLIGFRYVVLRGTATQN